MSARTFAAVLTLRDQVIAPILDSVRRPTPAGGRRLCAGSTATTSTFPR